MTAKQAEFVMVPREPTVAMLTAPRYMDDVKETWYAMLAAAPRYEPQGDAVEAAAYSMMKADGACLPDMAWAEVRATYPLTVEWYLKNAKMALSAAYPELVSEVTSLLGEVARLTERKVA